MTDNKLTNEQIIKVFELCLDEGDCKECLCYGAACITDNDVLDLIKRQQAEIKRLNAVSEICGDCHKKYAEKIQTAKSEAIKEFAKRVKQYRCVMGCGYDVVNVVDILLKEMTEQVNGKA